MNRSRTTVPLLVAGLVAALGGTSYAVGGQHHDVRIAAPAAAHHGVAARAETTVRAVPTRTQARVRAGASIPAGHTGVATRSRPAAPTVRGLSVHSLLRGSYTAGSARLSGTTKPAIKNRRPPEVTGRCVVGGLLVASPGRWSVPQARPTYQWLSDGRRIRRATRSTYSPAARYVGSRLSVEVTATKGGYRTATADSRESRTVQPGSLRNRRLPAVTGKAQVGRKLSTTSGSWSVPGVALSFRWLRGSRPIAGATGDSYKLRSGDVGRRVAVVVTARLEGYRPVEVTTASTRPVGR